MMKTLTALAAAGTIAIATVAVPTSADARNRGAAVAAGVIGGLAAGAIIGSAVGPRYYYDDAYPAYGAYYGGPYAYSRCYIVRKKVWTDYGPRWRQVRVCD